MYLHWPRPMCNVDLSPVPVTKAAAADFVLLEQVERFPLRAQSVRRPAAKQMPVAVLGHPAGASEVCFPGAPGAFGLAVWIEVQHDPCDLGPVGAVNDCSGCVTLGKSHPHLRRTRACLDRILKNASSDYDCWPEGAELFFEEPASVLAGAPEAAMG